MGVSRHIGVLAVLACMCGAPAYADDPNDPTMTPEAIARDSATIRRMNREQLDYVQRRDAGYAQGWRDYADARGGRSSRADDRRIDDDGDYARMRADYAEDRRQYESAMRDWREDVAACRAGYYDRCDRR